VFTVRERNLLHRRSTTAISIVCQVVTVEIPSIVTLSLSVVIVQKKEEKILHDIPSSQAQMHAHHISRFFSLCIKLIVIYDEILAGQQDN